MILGGGGVRVVATDQEWLYISVIGHDTKDAKEVFYKQEEVLGRVVLAR